MRLDGKIGCLFLLFLIFPLYAEPSDEEELPLFDAEADGELFFFEELFIFDEGFFFDEALLGEDGEDETFLDEDPLLAEEIAPDEDPFAGEEQLLAEETNLDGETSPGEESLLSEETLSDEEENPVEEGTLLAEEEPLDVDALFFEAPPMIFEAPVFEPRSFDTVFPGLSYGQKIAASNAGVRNYFTANETPILIPNPELNINLLESVIKKKPSHLIEALVLVPYAEREFDLLDIYNALGRIEKIKNHPATGNGWELYVFTESSRIKSSRSRKAIADPSPAVTLPFSETMYICLKEINFGNLFLRGDISISMYGITYSMTNFTDVRYLLVPIQKAERFVSIIYLEPVIEGMLIYSVTGFYLPGFIAEKVNLTPNINRRIEIFIKWITEGLRAQQENPVVSTP